MAAQRTNRKSARNSIVNKMMSTSAVMTVGMLAFTGSAIADANNPWADVSAVTGSITKDLSVSQVNTITQHTDRTVATAGSGDILSNQTVNILQNNSGSLFVLKTTGKDQDGSQIQGALNANGRVMVLDRNGVFFGANARIDVGGIVASTGDVDNDAVMRGDTKLTLKDFGDASVINNGSITVNGSGLAALVAPHVANNGVIQAKLGKVALASGGESATVDLYGDGLVELTVGGKTGKALAENTGTIEGATVLMTASGAKDVVDTVINMSGVIKATSATVKGGKIVLGGGNAGKVKVSGKIDASGATGGGSVQIGGEHVDVTNTASLKADAYVEGNGGDIRMLGSNSAFFSGEASAKGGTTSGNGGFIELSAEEAFLMNGTVDTTAANGTTGTFLLDPRDIDFVLGNRNFDLSTNRVYESDVEFWSILTNIDLLARRNFTVNANVSGSSDGVIDVKNGHDLTIQTTNTAFSELKWTGWSTGFQWVVTEANNAGVIDLTTNTQYGKNLEWKTSGNGNINVLGATAGDQSSDIKLSKLTTAGGDINVSTKNGKIVWAGDVATNGGDLTGTATGENQVAGKMNTDGGDIALTAGGSSPWGHTEGLYVTATGDVSSNGGNITLISNNSKAIINGKVSAGAGDLDLLANNGGRIEFWGNGALQGDAVNLESTLYISQGSTGKITANTLTGQSGQGTSLTGLNEIGSLGDFTANGFELNEKDGMAVDGVVSTNANALKITTNGTAFAQALDINGQLNSAGGDITLDSKQGGMFVDGKIDATATGDVTINSRHLQLRNGAVTADALNITAGLISQAANGKVTANTLTGTSGSTAKFEGTGNQIGALGNFTTGTSQGTGDFVLKNDRSLRVTGAVVTNGGNIAITNKNAVDVRTTGSLTSNNGDIALTNNTAGQMYISGQVNAGTGDVALDSSSTIDLKAGSTVTADALSLKSGNVVTQAATSTINAKTLTGAVDKNATLIGTNNAIETLGDFATGLSQYHTGGLTLNNNRALDVTGAVSTDGGAISLTTKGALKVKATSAVSTKGGNVTLTNTKDQMYINGVINAGNGDVTLDSISDVQLNGTSVVTADDLHIKSGNLVSQVATSTINAKTLTGTVDKSAKLLGTNNAIETLGNFATGLSPYHTGGFDLNNDRSLDITGAVTTDGGNINIDTDGNLALKSGGSVNAKGGNVDLAQSGTFASVDANSVKTTGTGTINLNQNAGGKIQNAIDAINNTGTGLNTVVVGHGTFNEALKADHDNLLIDGDGTTNSTHIVGAGSGTGITVSANNVTLTGMVVEGWTYGLEVKSGTVNDLSLDDIVAKDNKEGFEVANSASIEGLTIRNSHFDENDNHGFYAGQDTSGTSNINNVVIQDSSFKNNGSKGIYTEKLNNARLDNVDLSGNASHGADINLKYRAYDNIVLDNVTTGATKVGVTIKARNDGAYATPAASLTNLVVKNSELSATENALSLGYNIIKAKVHNNEVAAVNGISGYGGVSADIHDNTVTGTSGYGIALTDSTGDIYKNTVTGTSGYGVFLSNADNAVVGHVNATLGNTISGVTVGIIATNSDSVKVLNNTTTGGKNGIVVEKSTGTTTISHNKTSGATDTNAGRIAAAYTTGIGILVSNSTGTVKVSDNQSNGNIDGIRILKTDNATVTANTTNSNSDKGIIINDSDNVAVSKNKADKNKTGVWVEKSERVTLNNNDITGSTTEGVHLRDSKNTTVNGNRITGNIGDGVWVETSDDTTLTDNTITGSNASTGIKVTKSSNAIIGDYDQYFLIFKTADRDNRISNFATGISITDGTNNAVVNNSINAVTNGINASKTNGLVIRSNTLTGKTGSTGYGIKVAGGSNVTIGGSDVLALLNTSALQGNNINSFRDGILAGTVNGLKIEGNRIVGGAAGTGIGVQGSSNVVIGGNGTLAGNLKTNAVTGFADGISADDSDGVQIVQNRVNGAAENGVLVTGTDLAVVKANRISGGRNGVKLDKATNAVAEENVITGTTGGWGNAGIAVKGGSDNLVQNNVVNASAGNGILSAGSNSVDIVDNVINGAVHSGIQFYHSNGAVISGNQVYGSDYGISGETSNDVRILTNTIGTAGTRTLRNGIDLWYGVNDATVTGNTIFATQNAISLGNAGGQFNDNAIIDANIIDGGKNGVVIDGGTNQTVENNTISNVSNIGVLLNDVQSIRLTSNVITNSGAHGLFATGQNNGSVVLMGNTFTDNLIGAEFESGQIDLSGVAGDENTFNGGQVALRFAPAVGANPLSLSLVGNTIGETMFTGQSQYYVELLNGALFAPGTPTVINGLEATYDGFKPSTVGGVLTQAQFDAIETKIYHFNDLNSLGLFFFGAVPGIDDEDAYNRFGQFNGAAARFRVTLAGLPRLPGSGTTPVSSRTQAPGFEGNIANFLANLAPAAGGEGNDNAPVTQQGTEVVGELAQIEPAAGANDNADVQCWSQAATQASAGASVSYSFGGTMEETLNQAASCGGSI